MTLVQKGMNNRQTLNQVKELARAGKWQEASALIDTLPSTPDVDRLQKKIAKQVYISTGEIPAVDDVKVVDSKTTAAIAQEGHKQKRDSRRSVPNYGGLQAVRFFLYVVGGLAIAAGIIQLFYGSEVWFASVIVGISALISAEVWRVFRDIARNTASTVILLERLLDKE